ncbi:MAG: hypothetical protein IJC44_05435, partial [Clostridia bacterium]|nr:hypothetical protein [Clostridia bacterium]
SSTTSSAPRAWQRRISNFPPRMSPENPNGIKRKTTRIKPGGLFYLCFNFAFALSINIEKIIGNMNNYFQLYINVRRFTKIEKVIKVMDIIDIINKKIQLVLNF